MCGRYSFYAGEDVYERFSMKPQGETLPAHYNVAPGYTMPVVVASADARRLMLKPWGLPAAWRPARRLINARMETVARLPSFRESLTHRRCLVPARGFFEWRKMPGRRLPYYFRRRDAGLFAFAGIYGEDGYAILTAPAVGLVKSIHDRMPVILWQEAEAAWLNPQAVDLEQLRALVREAAAEALESYPVSARVNVPQHDTPDAVEPVAVPQ